MPRLLVIPHIKPLPENSVPNNNGVYMVPNSSNQRVRQQVQIYLFNNVSKNIKVMRVKWFPSHWMIFLTLTIDERPLQGEEQALEMFTQEVNTSYETPNGWRIKKFIPHVSNGQQNPNYDMYMHNFGISHVQLVEESRVQLVEDQLAQDRINEARTSISPHNRVNIFEPVVGIPVHEVN